MASASTYVLNIELYLCLLIFEFQDAFVIFYYKFLTPPSKTHRKSREFIDKKIVKKIITGQPY
jgi:hypothetical protein